MNSAFPTLSSNGVIDSGSSSSSNDDESTADIAKDIAIAGIVFAMLSLAGVMWLMITGRAKSSDRGEGLLSTSRA